MQPESAHEACADLEPNGVGEHFAIVGSETLIGPPRNSYFIVDLFLVHNLTAAIAMQTSSPALAKPRTSSPRDLVRMVLYTDEAASVDVKMPYSKKVYEKIRTGLSVGSGLLAFH